MSPAATGKAAADGPRTKFVAESLPLTETSIKRT